MSRISPKVIDVEGCRIATDDKLEVSKMTNLKGKNYYHNLQDGIKTHKLNMLYNPSENGRFPTQLFTNNKNEQFKYCKKI